VRIGIALVSAGIFALLAGLRLSEPGLYYDEAHQVPAALAWLGEEPGSFCLAPIGGVPLLTTTYGGALKSVLFAGLLLVTDARFTVALWRSFAVVFVLVGWVWCCAAVGRRWGVTAGLAFAVLFVTDMTVLLTTRHDWGPTALALCLRLAFLAIWLRADPVSVRSAMGLGAIVGLAVYEKLTATVLLAPLAFALHGRSRRHLSAVILALGLGLLPLVAANLATWIRGEGLISLTGLSDTRPESWWRFARDYLSLGAGDWTRRWVLDLPAERWTVLGEGLLLLALLGLGVLRPESRRFAGTFLAIGVLLFLLPRRTQAHHWILGTPFQYAAIAIMVSRPWRWQPAARLLLVLLVCIRIPGVADTISAIAAGRTGSRFDPALTQVAERLASETDALLVVATWGIGTQIRSFAHGRVTALHEPIYDDADVDAFARALASTPHRTLYLVEVPEAAGLFPVRTLRVKEAIALDLRWQPAPLQRELQAAPSLHIEKFTRPVVSRAAAPSTRAGRRPQAGPPTAPTSATAAAEAAAAAASRRRGSGPETCAPARSTETDRRVRYRRARLRSCDRPAPPPRCRRRP
jgi:hypothetical protein